MQMPKQKVFIKPGCVTQFTNYEKLRDNNIKRNAMRLNAKGIQSVYDSMFGPKKKSKSRKNTGKGKNMMALRDDEEDSDDDEEDGEYLPPTEGEGEGEFSSSDYEKPTKQP